MSKGSLFWANASGKLGETVLYRSGGEQRTRTYVAKIKNPKTLAQMTNRLLMNNAVSAHRALKGLVSQTFPNRKANQSAFNAFVQANKNVNRFYIGKSDLEKNACVPYGLQIAKGSLGIDLTPRMARLSDVEDPEAAPRVFYVIDGFLNLSNFSLKLPIAEVDSFAQRLTPELMYEVFSKCSPVALPSEFQVTVVGARYGADDDDLSNDMWQPGYRVTHCQQFGAYSQDYGHRAGDSVLALSLHIATKTRDENNEFATLTFDKLIVGASFVMGRDAADTCEGIVLSFKDASGYQVSNSRMSSVPSKLDTESIPDPAADYRQGGFYFTQLLSDYGYSPDGVLASTVENVDTSVTEPDEDEGGEDLTA